MVKPPGVSLTPVRELFQVPTLAGSPVSHLSEVGRGRPVCLSPRGAGAPGHRSASRRAGLCPPLSSPLRLSVVHTCARRPECRVLGRPRVLSGPGPGTALGLGESIRFCPTAQEPACLDYLVEGGRGVEHTGDFFFQNLVKVLLSFAESGH